MFSNILTINRTKSNLIIINLKQNTTINPINISCSAGAIKSQLQAKYQGLISNDKLNFVAHIKSVKLR